MIRLGPILTAHLAPPWQCQCRPDDPSRFPKILSPCRRLDVGRVGGTRGDGTSRRLVQVSALGNALDIGTVRWKSWRTTQKHSLWLLQLDSTRKSWWLKIYHPSPTPPTIPPTPPPSPPPAPH